MHFKFVLLSLATAAVSVSAQCPLTTASCTSVRTVTGTTTRTVTTTQSVVTATVVTTTTVTRTSTVSNAASTATKLQSCFKIRVRPGYAGENRFLATDEGPLLRLRSTDYQSGDIYTFDPVQEMLYYVRDGRNAGQTLIPAKGGNFQFGIFTDSSSGFSTLFAASRQNGSGNFYKSKYSDEIIVSDSSSPNYDAIGLSILYSPCSVYDRFARH